MSNPAYSHRFSTYVQKNIEQKARVQAVFSHLIGNNVEHIAFGVTVPIKRHLELS